ncbi:hypothetical protein Q5P01_025090 [Channa striata]|uniref:Uncharacterized protein n=1 Tax=Channa striata TaxID=64152 RepID=A0AA88LHX9_CHASR|nr:hypothetical protein Q5P01_025090 [Channa striata]
MLSYKSQASGKSSKLWEANTTMKIRDTKFKDRRLLNSPHPKFISQEYARSLSEQQLGPVEVVKVFEKVPQGFWLPPPNTCFNVPSKQLSKTAAVATKAVQDWGNGALSTTLLQVPISCSIRDEMVLFI